MLKSTTHQPFIASYAKDFPWLRFLLRSFATFSGAERGLSRSFAPPVVCTNPEDAAAAMILCQEVYPTARVVVGAGSPGYLRAQVCMMSSDLFCPWADYLYFFGSDCFVTADVDPVEAYFKYGKPLMLVNSYRHLLEGGDNVQPWWEGTSAALGFNVEYECMRRLPLVYPAHVLKGVRGYLEFHHKMPFDHYIYDTIAADGEQYHSKFSEANVIGSWARAFSSSSFTWLDLDKPRNADRVPPSPVRQFWSHGGIDRPDDRDGRTPRSVFEEVLGAPL